MSLMQQSLRAFAAGMAVACAVYAAAAVAAPPAETRVTIDNFTFKPETITIPKGTKLEWENDDDIPHTVVETQGQVPVARPRHRGQVRLHLRRAGYLRVLL